MPSIISFEANKAKKALNTATIISKFCKGTDYCAGKSFNIKHREKAIQNDFLRLLCIQDS